MKRGGRAHWASIQSFRIIVGAFLTWLATVFLLGAWWGKLLLVQAARIVELERQLGISDDVAQNHFHRTQRMLFWESGTFFGLLLICTLFLFWFYWRDVKRARGLQAFFASVTHELRTPLTSIRLQAESIDDLGAQPTGQKHLVKRLLEDTIRLEAQVERTLELARIEGGGPVYTQSVQLKPWLDRFLQQWKVDYQDKIELRLNVEDVLIEADPVALGIILKNLLENAVRHSKRNPTIITIETGISGPQVLLSLQDNGDGFRGNPKSLGKLFYKGPVSSGTGVGLYLVRMLMEKMGGDVIFDLISGFKISLVFVEGRAHG